MPNPDRRLWDAIDALLRWRAAHPKHRSGRCLEACRHALGEVGLKLPLSNVDYPGMSAITCGKRLALTPAKWGWKLVGKNKLALPTDRPSLCFFNRCGRVGTKIHGHVAIAKPSTCRIVSNETHDLNKWWLDRIAFVFVPG